MHGKHEEQRSARSTAELAIVVILLLSITGIVVGQLMGAPSERAGARHQGTAATTRPVSPTTPPPSPATSTTMDEPQALVAKAEADCRLTNLRQQAALGTGAVSLAQFDKHIDAMNLLVAGRISLSVATTFWEQTRVAAIENAAAFRAADKGVGRPELTCQPLAPGVAAVADLDQANAIAACAASTTAKGSAIRLARTAVTTWEHHVHDMERLRQGTLSPAEAKAAWRKSWKTGEIQLDAYEAALKRSALSRCSLS